MSGQDPVAIFRIEARDLLEQVELDLLTLAERQDDRETIDAVFRSLHTLKGSGAMFGFDALAAFTHHCETAFDRVRKGEVAASPALISAVLAARDHMRALAEGEPTEPGVEEALLDDLRRAVDGAGAAPVSTPPSAKTWRVRFSLPPETFVNGGRPLPLLDELRDLGPCEVTAVTDGVPAVEDLNPTDCRLAWDVVVTTEQPRSAIEDVFIFVIDDMTLDITEVVDEPAAQAVAEVVPDAKVAAIEPPKAANSDAPPAEGRPRVAEMLRVPAERLDELMDRVGELVIAQSRLKQVAASSSDQNLMTVSEQIEQLASELREIMMVVRMVPVGQLFGRFRRLIHDLAIETGKTINFATDGETTELDKTIIERLADPLVHLIRNAADHGLETPEQRKASGKPETGHILLAARQSGAEVVITITDDGRGVDRARVRAKAEENGLIQPGQVLTDNELLQLIFAPGFSTATAVTNLSGRGVGMDVVKKTIEGLRGAIEITSTPGQGSVVSLRIPLTLAIIDGLLVRVGASRYVIPLSSVEECVELPVEQDLRSAGRSLVTLRDQLVPFIRLRQMFNTGQEPDPHQKIVVVSTGQERVGLVVDQILGDHQTVIKPLSPFHAAVGAFSGATILGDGGVALILDIGCLVAAGQRPDAQLRAAG
ncbi:MULTISPECIES: chemotaxis protein CheA [Caulobacter]|uniref:Chemotaxis protein CheA n=1 Tax=Caulobacter vibrioides OR37 TaxID=1292034 RepID=R0D4C7_CAUVI|nr:MULTISPECIES: chemotaxis protein CheA [Caulobacter]ENZ83240.1 chemotaxis protein histidine kinase-like protein [Caulobacter vibrioides OR37]MBQ1559819.1 chemotaxis protein CheA [Caulobacter sp.]